MENGDFGRGNGHKKQPSTSALVHTIFDVFCIFGSGSPDLPCRQNAAQNLSCNEKWGYGRSGEVGGAN